MGGVNRKAGQRERAKVPQRNSAKEGSGEVMKLGRA